MGRVGLTLRQLAFILVGLGCVLVIAALMVLFGVLFGAVFTLVTGLFLFGVLLATVGFMIDVDKPVRG